MDLYTLTPTFLRDEVIDQFISVIWTDRYTKAGDVSLTVPASAFMLNKLAPGTFLSKDGSKEIMILETQSIENGLLTVTGESLLSFLENRIVRAPQFASSREWFIEDETPSQVLTTIVYLMCIDGVFLQNPPLGVGLLGEDEIIPNLSTDPPDFLADHVKVSIPFGSVYSALKTIAETYSVGIRLYLDFAGAEGYSLRFQSYLGVDRSSDQEVNDVVRISPDQDTLTSVKELYSISGYKNVAYAFAPEVTSLGNNIFGVAVEGATSPELLGFNRRSMMELHGDISEEVIGGSLPLLQAMLEVRARDALANNNHIKLIDGEVIMSDEFKFGTHYGMGDIIELAGNSGLVQKARVTEYIQTQDAEGERCYPTVSVLVDREVNSWTGETD